MTLSTRGGTRLSGLALVLLLSLAAQAAQAAPSGAADPDARGDTVGQRIVRAERLLTGARGADLAAVPDPRGGATERTFRLADVHCTSDPPDDTFVLRGDDDERVPFDEPRADLRAVCADYGDTLALSLRMAEPTDPAGWSGQTGVYWYIDITGDGDFDRAVAMEPGTDGTRAVVARRAGTGWQTLEGCDVQAGLDAGAVVARGMDFQDCLDGSNRVLVGVVTVFETADEVVHDRTDHMFATGRDGTPTLRSTARLAGANRYATAAAISRARFGEGRPAAAYLARADGFADALAAGSLDAQAATVGPILLVPSCGPLPAAVTAELDRLEPPEVVALGGESAVCSGVLDEVAQAGEGRWETGRLAGGPEEPTRWGTAVAISQHAYPSGGGGDVYLATGEDFPDALAAGSLEDGPLLLVPRCGGLPGVVADELSRLAPQRVVALGGVAAICDDLLAEARQVVEAGGDEVLVERLSGPTRLDTAAEVSAFRFPEDAERVYVARADDFPDALAGAMLQGGPILLVPRCGDLPQAVAREIARLDAGEVVALGGRQAVCDQMLRHAANA